jgi:hypothetical protein
MSFAADATVQLDAPPAPAPPPPPPPPPLGINSPEVLFRRMPESEMTPGPPMPAAAPVDLVDTSDAILDRCSAEPKTRKLCRYPVRLRNSVKKLTVEMKLRVSFLRRVV